MIDEIEEIEKGSATNDRLTFPCGHYKYITPDKWNNTQRRVCSECGVEVFPFNTGSKPL